MTKYWIYSNGQIHGPYAPAELVKKDYFKITSLVCPEQALGYKSDDWKAASDFEDISACLPSSDLVTEEKSWLEGIGERYLGELKKPTEQSLPPEPKKPEIILETERRINILSKSRQDKSEIDYISLIRELKGKLEEMDARIDSHLREFAKFRDKVEETPKPGQTKTAVAAALKTGIRKHPGFIGQIKPKWVEMLEKNEIIQSVDFKNFMQTAVSSATETEREQLPAQTPEVEEPQKEVMFPEPEVDLKAAEITPQAEEEKSPEEESLKDEYEAFLSKPEESQALPEIEETKEKAAKTEETYGKLEMELDFEKELAPKEIKPPVAEKEKPEIPQEKFALDENIPLTRTEGFTREDRETLEIREPSFVSKITRTTTPFMRTPQEFGIEEKKLESIEAEEKLTFSREALQTPQKEAEQTLRGKLKIDKLTSFFKGKAKEQVVLPSERRAIAEVGDIEKTEIISPEKSARSTIHVAKAIDKAKVTHTGAKKRKLKILIVSVVSVFAISATVFILMLITGKKTSVEKPAPVIAEETQEITQTEQILESDKTSVPGGFIDNFPPPTTAEEETSKTSRLMDKVIDIVKNYDLGGGRGAISQWFNNAFASGASGGCRQDWSATLLHGDLYVVQYKFLCPRTEPVFYQFEVDTQRSTITRGINNSAIELLATVKPQPASEAKEIEVTKTKKDYTPQTLPLLPLPKERR